MVIDWSKDITKEKSEPKDGMVSCRIPKKYKTFIEKNKIVPGKLLMRACEELDNSLQKK